MALCFPNQPQVGPKLDQKEALPITSGIKQQDIPRDRIEPWLDG
jgi:hypothetical protein